jgi:hypothetical protein
MKTNTIHSLITARTLLDEALRQVAYADRHSCSAALILLQDSLEIVMLSLLIEKDLDEQKSLESKSFDELIGELKKSGIVVPKSGTLKALNKERVIVKHYGQLAEPLTVQNYAEAAQHAIEQMVIQVIGKSLRDIFLTDRLEEDESKEHLISANYLIEAEQYLNALIDIRKAIFIKIEINYSVHGWATAPETKEGLFASMMRGGHNAPYYTRDPKWIKENVKTPIEYIQIDHEHLRVDCLERGVNTAELGNVRRLTPDVFRSSKEYPWQVQIENRTYADATAANANYCLDRAISILLKYQQYAQSHRHITPSDRPSLGGDYVDSPIYLKASENSQIIATIKHGVEYKISATVDGFSIGDTYFSIWGTEPDVDEGEKFVHGFVKEIDFDQQNLQRSHGQLQISLPGNSQDPS